MNLSENLRFLRQTLGLSQREMGELLEIPQTSYSNYENGTRELPNILMNKLTQIGVDVNWLLTNKPNKNLCKAINASLTINSIETAATNLKVPVEFLTAMRECRISPSQDFIDRMNELGYQISEETQIAMEKRIKEVRENYTGSPEEIQALQVQISAAKEERDSVCEQLEGANVRIAVFENEIKHLNGIIVELKRDKTFLQGVINSLQKESL